MERNEAQFEKIESYLRGDMPPAEVAEFEQQMSENPDLEMLVDMQRMEHDTMELLLEDELRAKMKTWQNTPPPTSGSGSNWRLWIWGSLLVVLTSVTIYFWINHSARTTNTTSPQKEQEVKKKSDLRVATENGKEPSSEEQIAPEQKSPTQKNMPTPRRNPANEYLALATEAYNMPGELNLRSGNDTQTTPLDVGMKAFAAKDYKKAIEELSQLSPEIGAVYYERAQELLGHAYFQNKQYREAARIFEPMANDPDFPEVRQYGEWYLLLSLLPNYEANRNRIDTLLQNITENPRHTYHDQAVALKEKIQSLK